MRTTDITVSFIDGQYAYTALTIQAKDWVRRFLDNRRCLRPSKAKDAKLQYYRTQMKLYGMAARRIRTQLDTILK